MLSESENTEYKENLTDTLEKEVVSSLNTDGGSIFIGVKDNGEVVGVVFYCHNSNFLSTNKIENTKVRKILHIQISREVFCEIKYAAENTIDTLLDEALKQIHDRRLSRYA
jgi:predicted HTH transcriptional regulator